jgi:hypothetical protein
MIAREKKKKKCSLQISSFFYYNIFDGAERLSSAQLHTFHKHSKIKKKSLKFNYGNKYFD